MKIQITHSQEFLHAYLDLPNKFSDRELTIFLNHFTSEFVQLCKNLVRNLQSTSFFHDKQKVYQIVSHALEKISESIYIKELIPNNIKKYINVEETDFVIQFNKIIYIICVTQNTIFIDNKTNKFKSELISHKTSSKFNIIPKFIFLAHKVVKINLSFLFYQNLVTHKKNRNKPIQTPENIHKFFSSQKQNSWNCFWDLGTEFNQTKFILKKRSHEFCGVSFLSN